MIKLEHVVLASPEQMKDFRCKCLNKPIDNRPQIIMGTRGAGKTTSLIKEAYKTDGIIVCPSIRMADNVYQTAHELGYYRIRKPITYDELYMYRRGRRYEDYDCYFDEYGMILISALCRKLSELESNNAKIIMIDEGDVKPINDILDSLKISDMNGQKIKVKIEISKEGADD